MERVSVVLFSDHLSREQMQSLEKYSTNVIHDPLYAGALVHEQKTTNWLGFFRDDTLEQRDLDLSQVQLTLVISH